MNDRPFRRFAFDNQDAPKYSMPFSLKDTWVCCDGAPSCPCPNHLGPDLRLPLVFPDTLNNHPSLRYVANGNECPTSDDEDVINRSIPVLEAQLQTTEDAFEKLMRLQSRLRLELFKVDREIVDLRMHQRKLSRALTRRKKINAPIRRLPVEILSYIFSITMLLPFPSTTKLPEDPAEDSELRDLATVCRKWLQVVFDTPILWCRLVVKVDEARFQSKRTPQVRTFVRHIVHSGQLELDLELDCQGVGDHNKDSELPPILFTLLERVSQRIKYLDLHLPSSMIHGLYPLHNSFDSLYELTIYQGETDAVPVNLFDKAPKLAVYLTKDSFPNSFGIPWRQITHHTAPYCADIDVILDSLEAATTLRVAVFSIEGISEAPVRPVLDPISCACLVYLRVCVRHSAYLNKNAHPLQQLFAQCIFPAFRELHVGTAGTWQPDRERDTPETFRALLLCLQRSQCRLAVLSYDNGPVAPADVSELFRTMRTILRVQITRVSSGLSDAAFESLWIRPGQVDVWAPQLKSILLEGELEFDAENFAAMVDSRWDVAPLSSITLHWHEVHDKPSLFHSRDRELDDKAVLEAKKERWASEGAILMEALGDFADFGWHLHICTEGCDELVEDLDKYR